MYTHHRISEHPECTTKGPSFNSKKDFKRKNRRDPHESASSFVNLRSVRFRGLRCCGHRYQQTALKRCLSSAAVSASCSLRDWKVTLIGPSGFAPEGVAQIFQGLTPWQTLDGVYLKVNCTLVSPRGLLSPLRG